MNKRAVTPIIIIVLSVILLVIGIILIQEFSTRGEEGISVFQGILGSLRGQ